MALRKNRLPRRWRGNALSPVASGQTVGLVVWDIVEGTSQRVECPKGFRVLLVLRSSGVSCSSQRECHWMWNETADISLTTDMEETLSAPPPAPKEEDLIVMVLALRVFHDLPDEVKWKVQQVHT